MDFARLLEPSMKILIFALKIEILYETMQIMIFITFKKKSNNLDFVWHMRHIKCLKYQLEA